MRAFVQSIQFKIHETRLQYNMKSEASSTPKNAPYMQVKVALVPRPLITTVAQRTLCNHKQRTLLPNEIIWCCL